MSGGGFSLLRHTTVYGVGQVLTRLSSVLMLPVYTRFLTPADYGTIAIFDLITALLAIVFGGGIAPAAQRYHFDATDETDRARIWSAAFLMTALPPLPFLLLAWWSREALAHATHGIVELAPLYSLVLPTLWLSTVSLTADTYLRTRKRSTTSVVVNLAALALNIALNLYLLIVAGLGVAGVLLGNLIATAAATVARSLAVLADMRPTVPSRDLVATLWRFGAPLVLSAVLAVGMHQLDRYLLRLFRDLEQVGVYSLAYTLAQGSVSLLLIPFSAAWEAVRYEIARERDASLLYARVFRAFVSAAALLAFAVALFADEIFGLVAPPDFRAAAALVPVLVLAYVVFSMHAHFSVPAYLHKAPRHTVGVFATGLVVNVAANVLLVPPYGAHGAAGATLVTFAAFSAVGLWRYSRLERYPYPLAWCAAVIGAMIVVFTLLKSGTAGASHMAAIGAKGIAWIGATTLLAKPLLRDIALMGAAVRPRHDSATGEMTT